MFEYISILKDIQPKVNEINAISWKLIDQFQCKFITNINLIRKELEVGDTNFDGTFCIDRE